MCLCGSTRFGDAFAKANLEETLAGRIVLTVGCVTSSDAELGIERSPELKAMLDELHMRKIDMADEVLILNVDGYIGESTWRELCYALGHLKRVRFLDRAAGLKTMERTLAEARTLAGVTSRATCSAVAVPTPECGKLWGDSSTNPCTLPEGHEGRHETATGFIWYDLVKAPTPELCGDVYLDETDDPCTQLAGHEGYHRGEGAPWYQLCGDVHRNDTDDPCTQLARHEGYHRSALGSRWRATCGAVWGVAHSTPCILQELHDGEHMDAKYRNWTDA